MSRSRFGAAFLFVAVVCILPGCMGTAKVVHQDPAGGVVAIPENTNVWPTYYRDAAFQKIRENYPTFDPRVDIVEQGEVTIGQQTRNDQRVDRRQIGPDGKPIGDITLNTATTTTTDVKEFRITYRVRPQLQMTGNGTIQQTGANVKPNDRFPGNGLGQQGRLNQNNPVNPAGRTGNSAMMLDPVPGSNSTSFGTR